jgi:CDGSH-type Zn-finger protein
MSDKAAPSGQRDDDDDVSIVAYPNGPFLVRGRVTFTTPDGEPLPPGRRTVALCRCGKSMRKPFCDGTHKMTGFITEPEPRPETS